MKTVNHLSPDVPTDNDAAAFRRYHTHRLHRILQHHSVSQLLNKMLPAEYLHLTRNLCDEERRGLSAAYKNALGELSEILEERSEIGANSVSNEQEKNIKLALSVLHRSVWKKAGSSGAGEGC